MTRTLPVALLLAAAFGAQAQQPVDSLQAPLVAVATPPPPDSLLPRFSIYCDLVSIRSLTPWQAPPFLTIQPVLTQAAGVQVTPTSGAPGDWAAVRIRGGSSLASPDQPLYVVDGVPALNADFQPGVLLRAAFGLGEGPQATLTGANPLLALSPEDISSITVISGGVAAAQYGAQGSNGVIEINTKRGGQLNQKQPLQVHYAAMAGLQEVRQRYDLLNARQYADLAREAFQGNVNYPASGPVTPDTDWQAELFRTATVFKHHLTFDGSGAKTRYVVGADYLSQEGVVINSSLKRYALRLGLDQKIGQRLRLFFNAAASSASQALPVAETVARALLAPPTFAVRTSQGSFQNYGPFSTRNAVDLATTDGTGLTTRRLLLQLGADYRVLPDLTLNATASREEGRVAASTHFLVNTARTPPTATATSTSDLSTTATVAQLRLTYDHTFGEGHRLGLGASAGYQQYRRGTSSGYRDYGSQSSYDTDATTTFSNIGLTASYAFRSRYEALASLRRDANHGGGLFFRPEVPPVWLPGTEVRWHLHQEPFLADKPFLSTATLWASLGQTSSTSLPATGLGSGIGSDYIMVGPGQTVTSFLSTVPVPPPPRTTQLEAGLRLGFWQDRLRLDITAFRRSTAHLTVPQYIVFPTGSGFGTLLLPREATLRNQGLLLAASSSWQLGRLKGNTRLAASWQQQRVTAVTEVAGVGAVPGLVEGEAPHPYFLYHRLPVPMVGERDARGQSIAGTLRYEDRDNTNGFINDADARYQGTALPTQLYTLSQSLALGRFTLDAQLDALAGHQLLNTTLATLDLPTGYNNGTTRLLDRWTPTHYSVDIPQASQNLGGNLFGTRRYDDAQLQSAANLRLSQLTLSFITGKVDSPHPNSIWVGAQNLFVLTNYRGFDPNVSSGGATLLAAGYDTNAYPVPRTWLVGARIGF
ncbi:TonB-dependent receptor plug domain-containing protein [Hymenobacter rubidus]|uniref:TonB-dependent receptor plug domain-containing protein n=1 Tax=Hymenobacter rubidus TaxID=1441626 RepID=UPI00191CA272|nr:TonB-dependent receptor plug domain-containing protein [Hymenobacter rubidus]